MFAALNSFQVGGNPTFVSNVFSTSLYTGSGTSKTITNGINLSNNGGLVWIKSRTNSAGTGRNSLWDTARGRDKSLIITNAGQDTGIGAGAGVTSFNADGFSLGTAYFETNVNSDSVVSWTFRKQPKFFDIVTYSGNSVAGRNIAHNLTSAPGCIMVKMLNAAQNWAVYHRNSGSGIFLKLNLTDAGQTDINLVNTFGNDSSAVAPTSSVFTVGSDARVNSSGNDYIAYIFAHDAGGFGASGNDNIISCGSYSGNSGNNTITLGYQPQWLMVKEITVGDANSYWAINDSTRGGLTTSGGVLQLQANSSSAEDALGGVTTGPRATSTGFQYVSGGLGAYNASGSDYIYVAIKAS